ncbi:MAG: DUF4139 domain-containing protein [Endomicrobium sp.]|jgi:hypothetical protein|nr:DUF4139 domain-containing protein [Endomicrobium sp.]
MRKIFVSFLAAAFFYSAAAADVAVTVYNSGKSMVRETREIVLKKGLQTLEFDEVASQIDATSVLPKFLNDNANIKVLEQNFDYDLVGRDKLLSKYIGKKIEIERIGEDKRGKLKGTLLSVSGGLVVKTDDKIVLAPAGEVSLSEMPEGLRLKPTLTWLVSSGFEGKNAMEVSYQTFGLSWSADYVLVTDEKDTQADIVGWVTINNKSGATYKNANIKVIAGDVNIVSLNGNAELKGVRKAKMVYDAAPAPASFSEKSFDEYHIYELQRKSTVKDNEVKQIEFITASQVDVKKVLKFNALKNNKITVNLEFKNSKENNLGVPLPKGRARVFKYDGASLEFVGEDNIDHTANNAKLSIYTGNAFDVTGERRQIERKQTSSKTVEESYKITLKNAKKEEVEVIVEENFDRWALNWQISENSAKYEKTNSTTAEFKIKVPADGEAVLTYKVKYSWK